MQRDANMTPRRNRRATSFSRLLAVSASPLPLSTGKGDREPTISDMINPKTNRPWKRGNSTLYREMDDVEDG